MNLTLHAEIDGNDANPAVIILHGLFGSSGNWRSIGRALSKSHQVISLDLRNHGRSPWHPSMSYAEMAEDVYQYIGDNNITNPIIIGHSMGGKTAMTLIQKFDVNPGKVFIVDISPVKYEHGDSHDVFIKAMQSINFDQVKTRNDVDQHLKQHVTEPPVRQFLMQNLQRDGEKYRWRINLNSIKSNMPVILDYDSNDSVENQVVFIAGEQSDYILPGHYAAIRANFPESVIETVPSAGHWLHAENPGAFLDILKKHLF